MESFRENVKRGFIEYNSRFSSIDNSDKFLTYVLRVCSGYLKITHDCVSGLFIRSAGVPLDFRDAKFSHDWF